MSRASEYANSVSSLYAQIGQARAHEAANKGAIWSGALANIGDFVAQYPKQRAQMEEIKNRAALTQLEREKYQREANKDKRDEDEDQKIRDLFERAHQEFSAGQDPVAQIPMPPGVSAGPGTVTREAIEGTIPSTGAPRTTTGATGGRTSPLPSPSEILRTVGPKKGIAIINGLAALKMTPQGDPEKSLKMLQAVANGLNALPEDMRAAAYPDIVKSFEARGLVKPGALQAEYSPEYWKFITGTGQEPPKPSAPVQVQTTDASGAPVTKFVTPKPGDEFPKQPVEMTPDQKADNARADSQLKIAQSQLSLAQQRELRESQNSKEPLIAVMKDGKPVLVKRSQAEGMTPASAEGGTKPLTQAETLDAGYAHRIQDAEATLKDVEPTITKMGLIKFTAESHFPAKAQSADFQKYDQASRNLINAILRRESGAAISQSEFDNAKRQYLPQPGDTADTLAQKALNRKRQFDALAQGAGRAYVPDAPAANEMAREGATKPIPGHPGTEQTYRDGKWIRTK